MSNLNRIKWIDIPSCGDERGVLTSIESAQDVPFEIKRVFYMHNITADRGGHVHRDTDEVLIAVAGSFTIKLSDDTRSCIYNLNDPTCGLYIPHMLFINMYKFSPDTVGLVVANTHYDRTKRIGSWKEYVRLLNHD